jgi:hypothetical protein
MGLTMTVDSIAGNVYDLERVLAAVQEMTGLKPFLRFELELEHSIVPVVLLMCGDVSLEFLEHAQGQHPAGVGRISRVLLEIPGRGPERRELEPGLSLEVRPGPKPRLAEIQVQSGAVDKDLAVLQSGCGAVLATNGKGNGRGLRLGDALLRFSSQAEPVPTERAQDSEQRLPGWHRIGLACKRLEDGVSALERAGGKVEVPPYRVLPGLREAMLRLPSGLMVQPVEQKLWKMLLVAGVPLLAAKITGRPLRFKTKEA